MGKVCTACGGGIVAPAKPENESELCSNCSGAQLKEAVAGACEKCTQGVPHEHGAM